MPKKPSVIIEEIDEYSDDEPITKPTNKKPQPKEQTVTSVSIQPTQPIQIPQHTTLPVEKPKRKLNLTDEQREQRRQNMLRVREIKMANAQARQQQRNELAEQEAKLKQELAIKQQEEIERKMVNRVKRSQNQITRDLMKELLAEEMAKLKPQMEVPPPPPVKEVKQPVQSEPVVQPKPKRLKWC